MTIFKKLFIVLALSFLTKIQCLGQKMTITEKYTYDCRKDSTWLGLCGEFFLYEYAIKHNKLKQVSWKKIKMSHEWTNGKFVLEDSSCVQKRKLFPKTVNYTLFTKALELIFVNKDDKIIGLNAKYFFAPEYLSSHSYAQIQDSLCKIKKEIALELPGMNLLSSISGYTYVETTYLGEKYLIYKSLHDDYWNVKKESSNEPSFKFFYPDWNIMINDLIQTPKKAKNELQIIHLGNQKFDIGRKILIPHKRKNKKTNYIIENQTYKYGD